MGKGGEFSVLGQVETERAGHLFHGFDLGATAHARHRDTHVDGWPNAGVEEVGFEEDLTIRDGDHVRRNIGGHVTCLGFDDWAAR